MQQADAAAVNRLSAQLGYPQSEADTAKQIAAVLNSHNDCAYVAVTDEGQVCGWIHAFATLRIESPSFVEIAGLVVDDQFRGQGIGQLLTDTIKAWCGIQGTHTLKVRSNVIRTDAHRFYTRLGFKESKEQKVLELYLL